MSDKTKIITKELIESIASNIEANSQINKFLSLNLKFFLSYYKKILNRQDCLKNFNSIEKLLKNYNNLDDEKKNFVRENYGGYMNHLYFFLTLLKKSAINQDGIFFQDIKKKFKNFLFFKTLFKKKAERLFGSGWIWLVIYNDELRIMVFFNEDNPWHKEFKPIIGIDLWEHAYISHFSSKSDYIDFIFDNINFELIEKWYLLQKNHQEIDLTEKIFD